MVGHRVDVGGVRVAIGSEETFPRCAKRLLRGARVEGETEFVGFSGRLAPLSKPLSCGSRIEQLDEGNVQSRYGHS